MIGYLNNSHVIRNVNSMTLTLVPLNHTTITTRRRVQFYLLRVITRNLNGRIVVTVPNTLVVRQRRGRVLPL